MPHTWIRLGAAATAGALALAWLPPPPRHADAATGRDRAEVLVFPATGLDRAASAVDVAVDSTAPVGSLFVEARGTRSDGAWTEWRRAADATAARGGRVDLPAPVHRVQVRVTPGEEGTGPGAGVFDVRVRPLEAGAQRRAQPDPPDEPYSARVFATRIGLVGDRTANGDTIRPDAHFVALPSRRGLSAKGGGEYTVRVCTTGDDARRCAYAPVWDVGPWNIKDDHWNADREMWPDLPRGRPQAQAAYEEKYNSGRDGFGRAVRNPAGIDLADGTFHKGLRLATNAWVQVDYLWTGRYSHRAEVRSGDGADPVTVRSGPGASYDEVGLAAHRANVDVACYRPDVEATEPQDSGDAWYRIGQDHYLPAANAVGGDTAPPCGTGVDQSEPTPQPSPPPPCENAPAPAPATERAARPCGAAKTAGSVT